MAQSPFVSFTLQPHYPRCVFFLKESFRSTAGKYFTCPTGDGHSLCESDRHLTGGIIPSMLPDLQMNDLLRLRKPHPCGSYEWTVIRLGADIGLECKGCQHRVMLTRRELAKRLKANLTSRNTDDQKKTGE